MPISRTIQKDIQKPEVELVFVFDAKCMENFKSLPGFSRSYEDIIRMKYDAMALYGKFMQRPDAEVCEDFKQVIPYIIVRHGDKILAYQRSKKSGESRLHTKWSIGIGGHINPIDFINTEEKPININFMLSAAIGRELEEELEWIGSDDTSVNNLNEIGVLYDNSTAVGRVHFGYIVAIDIPADKPVPKPKEDTIATSQWVTLKEAALLPNLESWSAIVIEALSK